MDEELYNSLFKEAIVSGENRNYQNSVVLLQRILSETDEYPEAFLYLGRSYHALGEFEKAIPPLKYFITRYPEVSAGYFFLGRTYISLKEYYSAVRILKKGLQVDPDNQQIISFLGLAYLRAKQPESALLYLQRAVENNPENQAIYTGYINALTVRAVQHFYNGNFDLARQMFSFVIEKGNNDIFVHVYLGHIYKELGDLNSSITHYDEAIKQSPDDSLLQLKKSESLFLAGRGSEALKIVNELKAVYPQLSLENTNSEDLSKLMAIQHFQRGEWKKAIYYGRTVIKQTGRDIDIHLLMGEAWRQIGKRNAAVNHFQRAIELDRSKIESRYGLSMVLWQNEEYESLLSELEKIKKINPGDEIAGYYKALSLCRLEYPTEETIAALQSQLRRSGPDIYLMNALAKEYIRADLAGLSEKWFKKSLLLQPDNPESQKGLIHLYSVLGKTSSLLKMYRNYLENNSKDHKVRNDYIQILVDNKKYGAAIKEILQYLPYSRNDKKILRLLAFAYRENGEYREASVLYRQFLRKEPKNENFLRSLVYTLERAGEIDEATRILESALEYITPSPSLLLILGVLQYRNNNTEKAMSVFRKVLTYAPNDWRAYKNMGLIYKQKGIDGFAEKFLQKAVKYKKEAKKTSND